MNCQYSGLSVGTSFLTLEVYSTFVTLWDFLLGGGGGGTYFIECAEADA